MLPEQKDTWLAWGVIGGAERDQPMAHGKRITIFQTTNKTGDA